MTISVSHALLARGFGDDGRRARAGASAHARSDEAHVHAFERVFDILDRFFGCGLTHFGTRARTKAARDVRAQLDALFRRRIAQRLRIGVRHDEIDAFDLRFHHVGNGIAPGAAHADHGDAGTQIVRRSGADIDAHSIFLRRRRFALICMGCILPHSDSAMQRVNRLFSQC